MELADTRPSVVIVGGGFGGLHAARALKKAAVRVTIVDRFNHHLFQPLLYQVATAALSPSDIAAPLRMLMRDQDADVVMGEVLSVDHKRQRLLLKDSEVPYDYLILAAGARDSYLGHDEWSRYTVGLKSVEDALEVRRRILMAYEHADRELNPEVRRAWMTFVLIGGGPTGVEMAGALAEISRQVLVDDFRHINPAETRIVLVEGSPRVLQAYPENLSAKALASLKRLGVEVHLGERVSNVDAEGVRFGNVDVKAKTVLWSAGVAASKLTADLGAPLDRQGRIKVNPDLSVPGHPRIFAAGDLVSIESEGKPVPGIAPAAMQQGTQAAENVIRLINKSSTRPFSYWDRGSFAVIGRGSAVGIAFKHFRFSGFIAWLGWLFIHIMFLVGFRNRIAVAINWAYSYLFFRRGSRIVYGPGRGDVSAAWVHGEHAGEVVAQSGLVGGSSHPTPELPAGDLPGAVRADVPTSVSVAR